MSSQLVDSCNGLVGDILNNYQYSCIVDMSCGQVLKVFIVNPLTSICVDNVIIDFSMYVLVVVVLGVRT